MSNPTQAPTTLSNIGVVMFTVSDQDAALSFYTEKLGFEVRSDMAFGDNDENRWLEVAPPGSRTRLALNPPMGGGEPGGSSIGVETPDVPGEHARLSAIGGIDVDPETFRPPGAPPCSCCATPTATTSSWWRHRLAHRRVRTQSLIAAWARFVVLRVITGARGGRASPAEPPRRLGRCAPPTNLPVAAGRFVRD